MLKRISAYKHLLAVTLVIFGLDQLTKLWVLRTIPEGTYHFPGPHEVIEGFLYWVHIYNRGAAWGQFSGYGLWLAGLGIAAMILIYVYRKKLELQKIGNQYLFGIITGGIAGNLIDRLTYGYVIDFIDVHLGTWYRWPAFNIADMGLTIGIAFYVFLSFFRKEKK